MFKQGERRTWRFVVGTTAVLGLIAAPAITATASGDTGGTPTGCTSDWPMFQHDALRHAAACASTIDATTVHLLHPQWFVQTSQPVTASPAVATVADKLTVYEGDNGGTFYDIDAATGTVNHTFIINQGTSKTSKSSCSSDGTSATDSHTTSYGTITSSAAVFTVQEGNSTPQPTVFVGAGGSLLALNASTLKCLWITDLDPNHPNSGMEAESSPVVFTRSDGLTEVVIGSDSNENPGGSAPAGVQAFNAFNGTLLWKFEPENNQTDTVESNPNVTNGCGDVWSSPAVDPTGGPNGHPLVLTTTGNCPNGSTSPGAAASPSADCPNPPPPPDIEGIAAIDGKSGCLVWRWSEPHNLYADPSFPDGGDSDFGSSPIITTVGTTPAVVEGGKSGYMYALNEGSGTEIWGHQVAQPGETGPTFAGAIGGFIGSSALGDATPAPGNVIGGTAQPTVFGQTAILAPLQGSTTSPVGVAPDTSLATDRDPTRVASLHAIDVATGKETWQAIVSLPSYAATTYANGVVFAPSTTGFDIAAYDANTGTPLWASPVAAAPSSGAAIVGPSIFFGAGTTESPLPPGIPPQVPGIWSFTTNATAPGPIGPLP